MLESIRCRRRATLVSVGVQCDLGGRESSDGARALEIVQQVYRRLKAQDEQICELILVQERVLNLEKRVRAIDDQIVNLMVEMSRGLSPIPTIDEDDIENFLHSRPGK